MKGMGWVLALAAAALAAFVVVGCLSVGGDDESDEGGDGGIDPAAATATAEAPPDTPEGVVRLYVEKLLNRRFAGDCAQATGADRGSLCITRRGERGKYVAFNLGPVLSELTTIVVLKPNDQGVWEIVSVTSRDPNEPDDGATPWPLEVGEMVVVFGTGDCLNVREEPRIDAPVNFCRPDGWKMVIQGGPVEEGGFTWWRLGGEGWAVQDYLRYPEDAPLPQDTPEAAPEPTPTADG